MDGNDAQFSTLQSAKHFLCNGDSGPPIFHFFLLSKEFSTWGDTFSLASCSSTIHFAHFITGIEVVRRNEQTLFLNTNSQKIYRNKNVSKRH